jgi:hypothetical protein
MQDFRDTSRRTRRSGSRGSFVASDEHMDITTTGQGRSDRVEGCAFEGGVVVFSNDENAHVKSPSLRS